MKRLLVVAVSGFAVVASMLIASPAQAIPGVSVLVSATTMDVVSNVDSLNIVINADSSGTAITVTANVNLSETSDSCSGNGTSTVLCTGLEFAEVSVSLLSSSSGDQVRVDDYPAHPLNATIYGSNGNDTLMTDGGADTLLGKLGDDTLEGRDGFDQLVGGGGADRMNDIGTDGKSAIALYSLGDYEAWRTLGVTVTLDDVANDGSVQDGGIKDNVGSGIRFVTGTTFDDVITGSAQDNTLDGMAGADILTGGLGVDMLVGKSGNDTLYADDGVADREISCNNSDESRGEQPNTAYVDALDPTARDCSNIYGPPTDATDAGTGSGGGASASYSTAEPVNTLASWTIPADLLPVDNPSIKNGFTFSSLPDVQDMLEPIRLPIMIQQTRHPLKDVPKQYQAGIENGDIFAVEPAVGTKISGSAGQPTWINLHVYETSEDPIPKGKRCPYDGKLNWGGYGNRDIKDLFQMSTLDEARSIANDLKCDYEIVKYKTAAAFDLNQPIVGKVNVVRNKSAGRARYVMEWTVFNSATPGLAVMLGPRDPRDWTANPKRADDFDEEITLDSNFELHASLGNKVSDTSVRVWVLDKSDGLFIGRANVEAWFDGEFLQSVNTAVGTGGLTLNMKLRGWGMLTITATYEDKFGNEISGSRSVWVSPSNDPFVTADGRCFEQNNKENWQNVACPTKGKDFRRLSASADWLRDRLVATGFEGASRIKDLDAMVALKTAAKELKVVPGMLGPGPDTRSGVRPRMKGVFLDWIVEGVKALFRRVSAVAYSGNPETGAVKEVVQGAVDTLSLPSRDSAAVLALSPEVANLTGDRGFVFTEKAVVDGEKAGLIAAGGQNLIAAGGQNLIAAGGQNLIAAGGQNADGSGDSSTLIAAGGQNMVNREGGRLIAAGGQNLIAAGGQNLGPAVLSDKGAGEKMPDKSRFEIPMSPLLAAGGLN